MLRPMLKVNKDEYRIFQLIKINENPKIPQNKQTRNNLKHSNENGRAFSHYILKATSWNENKRKCQSQKAANSNR